MTEISATPLRLARRATLVGALASLAACATARPILLDRSAMGDVKRIGLPGIGFPDHPTVQVTNAVGNAFGAIGLISTAIVTSNRVDALTALIGSRGFDPREFFNRQLVERVTALRLDLTAERGRPGDGSRKEFLEAYGPASGQDAILDIFVSRYGFIASSDRDDAPYRPAVEMGVRLVQARDRSILMQDKLVMDALDVPMAQPTGPPAPFAFHTFAQITADPDRAVAGLKGALCYAAGSVCSRLGAGDA